MHSRTEPGHNGSAPVLDVAGIGIGPFNLSLAALLVKAPDIAARFFERGAEFSWHPGLLFDDASLQSPIVKDCVTLVDPTNRYTFLNYLVLHHRLNRFIIAEYPTVLRREFNEYMRWICSQLDSVEFAAPVQRVTHDGAAFRLETASGVRHARDLVLGTGRARHIPAGAREHLGATVFHGIEYLQRDLDLRGKRVVVVGGGQTGAEIFYDVIRDKHRLPAHATWMTRRHNFMPFDESPFANELYVPGYTRFFYGQPAAERRRLLERQKASSDAILQPLLLDIYRRLYEYDSLEGGKLPYTLLVDREFTSVEPERAGWRLALTGPEGRETLSADVVILATGFTFVFPPYLEPLRDAIACDADGNFAMNEDFSIRTSGLGQGRIYAHNAALHSHGWADPNFAAMAWRSAVMINSIARREVYDLGASGTSVAWHGAGRNGSAAVPAGVAD